jgi:H+-translocating NAD(P) transhydrogenase
LTVGIPKEIFPNERRVALTPANAALLKKKGISKVLVERNAGVESQFLDEQYTAAGATLVSREELFASSDVMLKVRPPLLEEEAKHIREGSTVISFLYPSQNKPLVELLAKRRVTRSVAIYSAVCTHLVLLIYLLSFAMDMIPRISRAQVFDALR